MTMMRSSSRSSSYSEEEMINADVVARTNGEHHRRQRYPSSSSPPPPGTMVMMMRNGGTTTTTTTTASPSEPRYDNDKYDRRTRKRRMEQQRAMMMASASSNRRVDAPLVFVASLILCLVIFVELKTNPRAIARRAMESVEDLFHYVEKGELHAQMLSWRGWHSLEVGVEIACALTLGFLNWLLFASLFDVAGIIVGLIPAMATFLGVLVFRFHARSYFVLGLIPLVVVPAIGCAKLLERRMRVKEERRMKARKERRREERMARETRHENHFVVSDNSEDPTRARGRTTTDATVMRRAMSQGELCPTARVGSSGAVASNGTTIKGFNSLSKNSNGGVAPTVGVDGAAADAAAAAPPPIIPAKVNALAGQPRHARGSSAPELGFNQLGSSSSSSLPRHHHQQQQPGGAQNNVAGPPPPPNFCANILDLGGVEQNPVPVPKLQNPLPFANNNGNNNINGGAGGPNRPTTNLLNANPSRTAKRFNVRKPNLETIHSPLGTMATANTSSQEPGVRVSNQWENDDELKSKVEESL